MRTVALLALLRAADAAPFALLDNLTARPSLPPPHRALKLPCRPRVSRAEPLARAHVVFFQASNFFSNFDFFTAHDPTGGYVQFVGARAHHARAHAGALPTPGGRVRHHPVVDRRFNANHE